MPRSCTKIVRADQTRAEKLWRRREIWRLHIGGMKNTQIAELLGLHRNVISRSLNEGEPPVHNPVVEIEELDAKLFRNLVEGLDSDDPVERERWTRLYLERRGVPGAPLSADSAGVNMTVNLAVAQREQAVEKILNRRGYTLHTDS